MRRASPGRARSAGLPKLGASARRMLRGTTVRNTFSPKCIINCALTSVARLLRGSYMVRRMPSISSSAIGGRADLLDGRDQRRQALERVVLALHRDQHAVGCDQRIDRQHVERRRTVDERSDRSRRGSARAPRAAAARGRSPCREHAHLGCRQILVGRQHASGLCARSGRSPVQHRLGGGALTQQHLAAPRSMASLSMPQPVVALPCGSISISSTRRRMAAKDAARLTAVVVLPTPPF